ncbi:tyrosine-type recombinase/integrase [Paracoccus sp. S-4012]|uniref:tyrosine-type recombinase/integrase n=1 Tax=Paracoccus sp. S-4012 TaxID=2665648 RepID=UPI0012AFCCF9|nr:site-specific integrase [Paracoccus sp. S-4012]MRX49441.1 tyrosine-type recombinase/integrase [Paracoccus sp. S-4012]
MVSSSARRPEKALTAVAVRTASKPGKYFDGHGLYLRVEPNGTKFWVQRIVIQGKRRELGLGSASLVPLAEAREKALGNRKLAREGGDPLAARRERQEVLSFEAASRRVHELHLPTWRNEKHGRDFISSLESYAFPLIGKMPVSNIAAADVLRVLMPIWTAKPETARRVRQRIGTVLKWAVAQGWRQDNPADSITQALPKVAKSQVHRKSLPYAEVADCLTAVRQSRAMTSTKLAVEFLVLTAARSGEVREAVWEEVDDEKALWVIPAARMKAKRAHRVPLSPEALTILREARAFGDGSSLIFPGSRYGVPLSDMTLSKLVKELGFDADVHGFRTSFRTWVQEQTEYPRELAEAALAHSVGDAVEQAYARSDLLDRRRAMMEAWSAYLQTR